MEIFSFTFGLFQPIPQLTCETRQLLQFQFAQTRPRREEICIGQGFGLVAEAFAFGGGLVRFSILLNPSAYDEFLQDAGVLIVRDAAKAKLIKNFVERVVLSSPHFAEDFPAVAFEIVTSPRRHVRVHAVEIQFLEVVDEESDQGRVVVECAFVVFVMGQAELCRRFGRGK